MATTVIVDQVVNRTLITQIRNEGKVAMEQRLSGMMMPMLISLEISNLGPRLHRIISSELRGEIRLTAYNQPTSVDRTHSFTSLKKHHCSKKHLKK